MLMQKPHNTQFILESPLSYSGNIPSTKKKKTH